MILTQDSTKIEVTIHVNGTPHAARRHLTDRMLFKTRRLSDQINLVSHIFAPASFT
jgi:hypothetical protein